MRVLLAVLLIGIVGCGGEDSPGEGAVPTLEGSQATVDKSPVEETGADPVTALKMLGACINGDKFYERGEVVEVIFYDNNQFTDAGLVHLEELTALQRLWLEHTQVTDAGLVHLTRLSDLQALFLPDRITDAGLVHLKGLGKLQVLDFADSPITDAGLVHLKGLANLRDLYLHNTQITDAGVADLQKALPNCKIYRK